MRKILICSVAAAAMAAATVAIPSATYAQRGPGGMMGGMMGGYGGGMMGGYGGGMMGPGYGMRGNFGPGMMGGCGMMGAAAEGGASTFAAGRLAFLKAELGITDAQKAVWDTYAEAIKDNLTSMQGMWQMMNAVIEAKTPAERLDARIAAMESRVAALKEVKPALEKLYAALSDTQKGKADEILTGMGCMM
ncbi:MAG: Spy/CpxP family protein refolding chaperone [Xanthobacteraceae bacterium]|nr:Spy/CpxP family protein refolding chaperone [Xanthobacteraceae bacterium]